jgi:putative selenate reductase
MEFLLQPVTFKIQQAVNSAGGVKITDVETGQISQKYQVLNIGDFCNECGNCATFCPTSGAPYRDKPKFHITEASFTSADFGYRFTAENRLEMKKNEQHAVLDIKTDGYTYENATFKAVLNSDFSARQVEFKNSDTQTVSLLETVQMAILSKALHGMTPFNQYSRV